MPAKDLFGREVISKWKEVSRETLAKALHSIFRSPSTSQEDLVRMMYSEFDAVVDFFNLCQGEKTGQRLSLLFNPHRLSTAVKGRKTIMEGINSHASMMDGLARAVIFKAERAHPRSLLYQTLQLGINSTQYVNEFPPHVARSHFLSFQVSRVLDPCAGWGGRMIGAASMGAYYEAWEPSTKTYEGLKNLGEWLKRFETGFDFQVHHGPFEDAKVSRKFDLAYTSPPYFDTEQYSDEPTQSFLRYPIFEDWVNGFYLPMIEKALDASEKGLVLNIGMRRFDLRGVLKEKGFRLREIPSMISQGGLGRQKKVGERFFHITRRS